MGLCKCPKRKVTNQFCYEHRVNVCEYCMVNNHPKCIVLSYLQWLQDSDYNPICELCSGLLSEAECVRLICYHVYHWQCLDNYAGRLPSITTSAGYTCPSCNTAIFPPSNLVSPVADILKNKLNNATWAHTAVESPTVNENNELIQSDEVSSVVVNSFNTNLNTTVTTTNGTNSKENGTVYSTPNLSNRKNYENHISTGDAIVYVEEPTILFNRPDTPYGHVPRRLTHITEETETLIKKFDHDENKYHRRAPGERLNRWKIWATTDRPKHSWLRKKLYAISAVMFLFVIFFILLWISKGDLSNDDMLNNPNIRIQD